MDDDELSPADEARLQNEANRLAADRKHEELMASREAEIARIAQRNEAALAAYDRQNEALERIADALEKLAGR